jgi:hypothetical protein
MQVNKAAPVGNTSKVGRPIELSEKSSINRNFCLFSILSFAPNMDAHAIVFLVSFVSIVIPKKRHGGA